jgi:GNAT superfamily N-acetyltransferase
MGDIVYCTDRSISAEQLAQVFIRSGIRRPVEDLPRLSGMLDHANVLVTAWDGERLVGVARGLSDFHYCCYLSDLAVDREYQRTGIGRKLVDTVQALIGEKSMLLLLAAPEAMAYYPRIGFDAVPNGWMLKRAA